MSTRNSHQLPKGLLTPAMIEDAAYAPGKNTSGLFGSR